MKFTIPLALFAVAATVEGAALAKPEPEPWCLIKGQSCWKDKRETTEVAKREPVEQQSDKRWCTIKGQSCWKRDVPEQPVDKRESPEQAEKRWCLIKGQSCWKVKRAAEAFAEAIQSGEATVQSREAEYSNQAGHAAFMAKRQVDELALAVAAATDDPEAFYHALGLDGQFDADTAGDNEKRDVAEQQDKRWCLIKGQSCWKDKREPAEQQADKRWCLIKGQSCWKAKRAAEAVVNAIDTFHDPRSTPFGPEARVKRSPEPWCLIKGQSCWKRDANAEAACNGPSGACTKARRDLHAIYSVARSIVDQE